MSSHEDVEQVHLPEGELGGVRVRGRDRSTVTHIPDFSTIDGVLQSAVQERADIRDGDLHEP